ncbi:DUF1643 domain-containing protein [Flavobacteriaceae bacterium TP-CH-4]|uniref:DUF1643 domain-containing protein n=1 Tax=Pelagihabitans pacificus TaxID=2696054 RepID=A0A967APY7_9FLAO|nr:DUF1643 domain-containing protein [Pelagihabitans pacificus]NHF58281.1 DUF1643 domain-containing protein [Pelagihabitans pacificus]
MTPTWKRRISLVPQPSAPIPDDFEITGRFYVDKHGFKLRDFLNIKRRKSEVKTPDLMVVMMNPGSSRPMDGKDNCLEEVPAKPDSTQYQIIRLMNQCRFNYARILNLSDLREPKSTIFYGMITELDQRNLNKHSIFSKERTKDFDTLFVKGIPVVCAWGVDEKLSHLAAMAMERIAARNILGKKKEVPYPAYYHPLPRKRTDRENWLVAISEQISSSWVK